MLGFALSTRHAVPVPGICAGRLVITSKPTGAKILINDKTMPQVTDFAYVVSPGKYTSVATLVTNGMFSETGSFHIPLFCAAWFVLLGG